MSAVASHFILLLMTKLDPKFTLQISSWLETPEDKRDIVAGAELLLKLNRNMAMYNSAVRRPEKYAAKIAYELRKFLNIRQQNMSVSDVTVLEADVMPRIEAVVEDMPGEAVISTDDERPHAKVARGKRPDHDSLPEEIRDIYEQNGIRHRKMILLYNELKAMSDAQPCDRIERLKLLDEAERTYREGWQRYDSYVIGQEQEPDPAIIAKRLAAARKTLSKYRKVVAASTEDNDAREKAVAKIRSCVAVIKECGGDFSTDTVFALKEMGIEV